MTIRNLLDAKTFAYSIINNKISKPTTVLLSGYEILWLRLLPRHTDIEKEIMSTTSFERQLFTLYPLLALSLRAGLRFYE